MIKINIIKDLWWKGWMDIWGYENKKDNF